jgi:cobalt-zinc-cadmium efflux system protein
LTDHEPHTHHDHGHAHHHGHHHGHHHHLHHQGSGNNNIAWAFFLNLGFTLVEFIGGIWFNSAAIMADAVHDLGDSFAIGLAWIFQILSVKAANQHYSYGYRRFSLLAALINSGILLVGAIWIVTVTLPRLFAPQMPNAQGMVVLAILGCLVNGYAVYKLSKGTSLNERALNLHLLEDVLGWVAILVVAVVLNFVDWPILDPILSLIFTVFIVYGAISILRSTGKVFLQAVPDQGVHQAIRQKLEHLDQVDGVHHLHLWSLDGEHHVLTAHLVLAEHLSAPSQKQLKATIATHLAEFNLAHTTIEFEWPGEVCRDG